MCLTVRFDKGQIPKILRDGNENDGTNTLMVETTCVFFREILVFSSFLSFFTQ